MRGSDARSGSLFSYVDLESRVPGDHPLRVIRSIADEVLDGLSARFEVSYARIGRPSIPPERLMRALLLQAFYSIRSARQLMERLEFDLLFRWFVGLGIDDRAWDASTFSKTRASGVSEGLAGIDLADQHIRPGGTLGADKGFDTADFVAELRDRRITPHVAQNSIYG